MKRGIPVVGFAGHSGVGKTTLLEKLVSSLREDGVRVAVVKHDRHDCVELDREGKDSWRFTRAGADVSVICSGSRTAVVEQRALTFAQVVTRLRGVDLILVEGFKDEKMTQIGLRRMAARIDFPGEISRYAAVVTDVAAAETGIPQFGFDEIRRLKQFLLNRMDCFTDTALWEEEL